MIRACSAEHGGTEGGIGQGYPHPCSREPLSPFRPPAKDFRGVFLGIPTQASLTTTRNTKEIPNRMVDGGPPALVSASLVASDPHGWGSSTVFLAT
jgi:hypothetical protein